MTVILNKKQQALRDDFNRFWKSSDQVYEFSGYAGTGKSFMLNILMQDTGLSLDEIAPMSFIGQAAIVMRLRGLTNAKTIHSWLLNPIQQIKNRDGVNVMDNYFNTPIMEMGFESKPLEGKKAIIIDEAGSCPMYLKNEIESRGLKVIATGDIGQLPPVGDKPAYLYDNDIIVLDELMRQDADSGIAHLATRVRQGMPIHKGLYGNAYVIDEDELTDEMVLRSGIVLCGKNKTRDAINNKVRKELLGITSELPVYGERVICRKNNWYKEIDGISLANGLCGIVDNMPGVHTFEDDTFEMDFMPNMLTNSFKGLKIDYEYLTSNYEKRNQIKHSRYREGEKFEFSYANTIHTSQGSEYPTGVMIEEFLNKEFHSNLLYTGITRFKDFMILVKRKRKYFPSY